MLFLQGDMHLAALRLQQDLQPTTQPTALFPHLLQHLTQQLPSEAASSFFPFVLSFLEETVPEN
jgi:hypothetical protein